MTVTIDGYQRVDWFWLWFTKAMAEMTAFAIGAIVLLVIAVVVFWWMTKEM
jgi:hypothetical protein